MKPGHLALLSMGLLGAALAVAQEPVPPAAGADQGPVTTLKLETKLVAVAAVVRNDKGQPVHDLTRDDFILKEDGKVQPIRYFSQGSDLPLTLALMVDTSSSQANFIKDEVAASHAFFPAMLTRPEDRAVLIQFDYNVLQLQAMTNSPERLVLALDRLYEPHRIAPTNKDHGGTLLYDAIAAIAQKIVGKEEGRRAIVILTDGGDDGSRTTLSQAISLAQAYDVMIYSVYYGEWPEDSVGYRVLQLLSEQTGGHLFKVGKALSLAQIYAQIEEDLRLQYQLGYAPPPAKLGAYHRIDLSAKNKHLVTDARKGYFTRY